MTELEKAQAARIDALERLLVCYRTGKRPSESLLAKLDASRDALAAAQKQKEKD